jgi:hypothetical protein
MGLYLECMEDSAQIVRIALALIERQRRLADSHDPLQRAGTLWIAAELNKRLSRCTDAQIAELLARAEERLPIFEPEFAVVEHARRRLLRSGQMSLSLESKDLEVVRDEGVHILNAEVALYRASIPSLLLPFQRNRFASDLFMVPDVREARGCLIAAGFRSDERSRSTVVDADSDRPVRLIQER